MASKKRSSGKGRALTGIAAASVLAAGALWLSFGKGQPKIPVPAYTAQRVIDGDTFVTPDHVVIRLAEINSPEQGLCGSSEATSELKKLVMKKNLYIKSVSTDKFNRVVAFVYSEDTFVNEKMVQTGNAYYEPQRRGTDSLRKAEVKAKKDGIGIFGNKCSPKLNTLNPRCDIKANINSAKEKIYFTKSCVNYKATAVELYKGEKWFCSETEAKGAGFRKSGLCSN